MFVVLFRKSVNTALPLLSIPLIPEGNISGTEERNNFNFCFLQYVQSFSPSDFIPLFKYLHLSPYSSSFSLSPHLLSTWLLPLHLLHSLCPFIPSRLWVYGGHFSPLQQKLHISTPLHFSVFPPFLFFYHMHLSLFFYYLNWNHFNVIQKCLTSWSTLVLLFNIWIQLYFRDVSIVLRLFLQVHFARRWW